MIGLGSWDSSATNAPSMISDATTSEIVWADPIPCVEEVTIA